MMAYVAGDQQASTALFGSLMPRIRAYFERRFRGPDDADDLLQQTVMKIHGARRNYRAGESVRPWVFAIAARVGFDERRRRVRRPETTDEHTWAQAKQSAAIGAHQAPELVLERAARCAQVRTAICQLPESHRLVIVLHLYHGLTFGEIGKRLGTSEGAVKLRAFRGYERLRQQLTRPDE